VMSRLRALLSLLLCGCRGEPAGPVAWFVSWQHAGHIRALCPAARELRRRGWRVALVVHDEARGYVPEDLDVVSAGPLPWTWEEELEFRDLLWAAGPPPERATPPSAEEVHLASVRRAEASENYFAGSQRSLALGLQAALLESGEALPSRPLIVADVSSVGAMDIAELLGLNFVVFSSWPVGPTLQAIGDDSSFQYAWLPSELFMFTQSASQKGLYDRLLRAVLTTAMPRTLEWAGFHTPRRGLRLELGLPASPQLELLEPPRLADGSLPLVLVANHWALDRPRPLPPHIRLVGPTENYTALAASRAPLAEALQDWLSKKDVVVYVSLGTNVRPQAAQVSSMIEGMRRLQDIHFLWDIREGMRPLLTDLPDNVRAEEWVDQLAVLASGRVSAFVSHCGLNSLHEALHFGVPIVALPYIADQLVSARIVEEAGVGRRLAPARLSSDDFAEAVDAVARGTAYREAARRVGRFAAGAGGAIAAADLLEMAATQGVGHLQMRNKDGIAGRLWDVYLVLSLPVLALVALLRLWLSSRGESSAVAKPKGE